MILAEFLIRTICSYYNLPDLAMERSFSVSDHLRSYGKRPTLMYLSSCYASKSFYIQPAYKSLFQLFEIEFLNINKRLY